MIYCSGLTDFQDNLAVTVHAAFAKTTESRKSQNTIIQYNTLSANDKLSLYQM